MKPITTIATAVIFAAIAAAQAQHPLPTAPTYAVSVSGTVSAGPGFIGTATVSCPTIITPDNGVHVASSRSLAVYGGQLSVTMYPTDWSVPVPGTPCSITYSSPGTFTVKAVTITAAMAGTAVQWAAAESTPGSIGGLSACSTTPPTTGHAQACYDTAGGSQADIVLNHLTNITVHNANHSGVADAGPGTGGEEVGRV